ncbi:hypothetical protein COCNU_01G022060 [Cocos nucifera]|uniref:Uncharacterized protein n=1 Tax=Cocos nucifera TaxID=13894 RepID=A0A8K0MVT4_COCNU|nr:hypothetical protein COCNU_01G022060 [Cocos nucifera]
MSVDLFSDSAQKAIDTFTELCSPPIVDQILSPFICSAARPNPGSEIFLASPNSQATCRDSVLGICDDSRNSAGVDDCLRDDSAPQNSGLQAGFLLNSLQMDVSGRNGLPFNVSDAEEENTVVPKSMMRVSLAERLLKALSLFKESSGAGILAQVWMPMNQGDKYVLSTYEQPYLVDQILAGYREVSRSYTFSAKEAPGSITGLPGRVFASGMPEWTSNIAYYHRQEYWRVEHALDYEVRGLLAVPIFDLDEHSCSGVLELVTVKEKSDFDSEMERIFGALQAVDLRSVRVCDQKQGLKMGQKPAFTEILDVLRAICHAHMLPLALTWVPLGNNNGCVDAAETNFISDGKIMLCIQESACYVNDQQMQGFLHACSEHHLQNGQGVAGKAIQSTHPIFSPDIKSYDVRQYPLAHHARKFGLHAAVAIRLRSTHTGNDDYILEFLLPINCKGSVEQQLLLNNMSITLQRICRSLRTVSDTDLVGTFVTKEGPRTRQTISVSPEHSQQLHHDAEPNSTKLPFKFQDMEAGKQEDAHPGQGLKMGQKPAFTEILDVLRAICHAHMLPLALTWVPLGNNNGCVDAAETNFISDGKIMLCIQESACYVNDQQMQGFLHACSEHHLQNGQGVAGKAIQSTHPIFSPDIKSYDVRQYPLAHHARKFGLHAAVAIRLRSTHTGNDDYILEFLLPINCKGSVEQQLLLNNMSITLQRICRSLRTVSDTDLVGTFVTKEGPRTRQTISVSPEHSQQLHHDAEPNSTKLPFKFQDMEAGKQEDAHPGQMKTGSPRHPKKKHSTVEKNISLSVLQQYYSETLKHAAKSIGVCPTTLKRICRRHGISRWPSRSLTKASHSLSKIQNMLDSVPGVAGMLKYDNATGKLFTEVSSPEKQAATVSEPSGPDLPVQFGGRLEEEACLVGRNKIGNSGQPQLHHHGANKACIPPSSRAKEKCCHDASTKDGFDPESLKCNARSKSSSSMAMVEEMDASEQIMARSHPSNSSMADSSSGSASSCITVKRSLKNNTLATYFGSAIHVKATYKEETIRFKFSLSMGVHHLIEVIGKRFELCSGTFHLRYMDDEKEWVMLADESDLQECVEVLQSMQSQSLRLLVRDLPFATSSLAAVTACSRSHKNLKM